MGIFCQICGDEIWWILSKWEDPDDQLCEDDPTPG